MTPSLGKLEFPALYGFIPLDAPVRLEVFLEARGTPSNYSFLSNKQAANVCFSIHDQFVNKSEHLITVFINF